MNNNQDESFNRNQYMPPNNEVPQPVAPAPKGTAATTQSAPPSGDSKKIPVPLIVGFFILLFIAAIAFALSSRNPDTTSATGGQPDGATPQVEKVIPTIDTTRPALSFTSVSEPQTYRVNQEITVRIKANSLGGDIYGYDLLFPYDKTMFEIVETKSALDSFQIFSHDREDYYAVTGLKLLSVTTPVIFEDTEILEMTIKPLKAGTIYLEVLAERGKETSKFVDKDSKVIQPQIQPIKLDIQ